MMTTEELKSAFRQDRFASHTGVEIVDTGAGRARTRLRIQPQHMNGLGVVQGGAIFTLADLAFAVAANSHGVKVIGLSASVNWLRATRGGALTAEAVEVSCTRRIATYTVNVTDEEGRLVATFHGTGFRMEEHWDQPSAAKVSE